MSDLSLAGTRPDMGQGSEAGWLGGMLLPDLPYGNREVWFGAAARP
jgi:hypothetical protein